LDRTQGAFDVGGEFLRRAVLREVGAEGLGLAARPGDAARDRLGLAYVGAAMNGDRGAQPRQLERNRRAGARRRAGDEGDLAGEGNGVAHGSTSLVQIDLVFDLSRYFS
jgi:hypothetical protein